MNDSKFQRWALAPIFGLLFLLLLLCFGPYHSPRTVSVDLTGPVGLVVAGHWTVDGVQNEFRATLPTNFVTQARSLSFELVRQGDPGIFKIQLAANGAGPMSSESEYGIRGGLRLDGAQEARELLSFGQ